MVRKTEHLFFIWFLIVYKSGHLKIRRWQHLTATPVFRQPCQTKNLFLHGLLSWSTIREYFIIEMLLRPHCFRMETILSFESTSRKSQNHFLRASRHVFHDSGFPNTKWVRIWRVRKVECSALKIT